ncbi:PFL_4695 family integrating conjugative element protein [Alicycliphilus denitrificans]|uniref:PFL_4695 family integrating conjugative element protein n=1 Tax=Alicycliphilus denitrificans TaxID=179636 RepID=UPI00384EF678
MSLPALCVALLAAATLTCPAFAQRSLPLEQPPMVVHDSGRSVPLAPYVAQLVGDADDPGVLEGLRFPFGAGLLRSGVLAQDGVQVFDPAWLTQSMFVLAADELSLRWLAFNHDKLVQLQAVGIVVQAGSPVAFKVLQRMASPLRLAPETSSWLSQRLVDVGAGVYPVLVHSTGKAHQILFQMFQEKWEVSQ